MSVLSALRRLAVSTNESMSQTWTRRTGSRAGLAEPAPVKPRGYAPKPSSSEALPWRRTGSKTTAQR